MPVELKPITKANYLACIGLTVAPEQKSFVASNAKSLAQACYEDGWVPLAAYVGEEMVGFVMYGPDPETGSWWIIRVMVDAARQGRGYGRAITEQAITWMRREVGATQIYLDYARANTVAANLYRSLGFVETGDVEDDSLIARLDLGPE